MVDGGLIDTTFDMRSDAGGRDPDSHSKTLRRYHQLLWSKPLPSGAMFDLDAKLHHKSALGEYWLASDSIAHTYSTWVSRRTWSRSSARSRPTEVTAFSTLPAPWAGTSCSPRRSTWRASGAGRSTRAAACIPGSVIASI